MKQLLITDLDGTLLDRNYSYDQSLDAINWLKAKGIPLIFCSAKTRAEQEEHRRDLGIKDPFIVENGGAVLIPEGYFSSPPTEAKRIPGYHLLELGVPYAKVRGILKTIEGELGVSIIGFGDMSPEEVSERTRLDAKFAVLSKIREYDEPFYLSTTSLCQASHVVGRIEQAGLRCAPVGSHFSTVGNTDKGKAVRVLMEFFRRELGEIETIGLGDSQNDLPMLACVDIPLLVQQSPGQWADVNLPGLRRVEGVGPEGWSRAVEALFVGG
jgi:mannosyl-3-phosphoglycerate phosphatase